MTPPRVVFLYKPDGRIDYPAMRNAATKGTLSSRQIRAAAERAARKAAKAAEGKKHVGETVSLTSPRARALPPRELPHGVE